MFKKTRIRTVHAPTPPSPREPARPQSTPGELDSQPADQAQMLHALAGAVAQAITGLTVTVILRQADGTQRSASGTLQTQQRTAGLRGIPGIAGGIPIVK